MTGKVQNTAAIDFSPQFRRALELMEKTHRNAFITGRAGTGKSTLLNYFKEHTSKKAVILAPTGVAAINVAGQTIHYDLDDYEDDLATLKDLGRL